MLFNKIIDNLKFKFFFIYVVVKIKKNICI